MNPNIQKTELEFIETENIYQIKMTLSRLKDSLQYERKCLYYISIKGIQSRIYTELLPQDQKQKTVKNEKI